MNTACEPRHPIEAPLPESLPAAIASGGRFAFEA